MPVETLDLSGDYIIDSLSATELVLRSPQEVNPNWYSVSLDGAGTTGYVHSISVVSIPETVGFNLNGTYTITSVTADTITLDTPEVENSDWIDFWARFFPGMSTANTSAFISKNGGNWQGPFIVDGEETSLLVANFVALGGLFKDNGKKQKAFPITMEVEATPVDSDDDPIGAPQTFSVTIPGNDSGRDQRAATLVCELTVPGRQSVRARRTTPADYSFKGTIVDEVKWQDLYGLAAVNMDDFGDVTTLHSRNYATEGALAVKERKLTMLATRLVPIRTAGTSFDPPAGTTYAADIFTAICLDPYIGNRQLAELDLDSIYGAAEEAVAYHGSLDAARFSFTLDDDNLSFEETCALVANAIGCNAYRQGSLIKLHFERATSDSELLFNHRNKVPGTETRTVRFGNLDDNNGVELEWTDPHDDAKATIYLPVDRSATQPKQIKGQGIRTYFQAYVAAWRAWNKIRYQNTGVEFTGLQEATIVARNSRVLVADNTRPDTQDGEVIGQAVLVLNLSQPVTFDPGEAYTLFLQLPDGTLDAIPVTSSGTQAVLLSRAPRVALSIDDENYAQPTYQLVRNDSPRQDAFLITEREPESNFTFKVTAVNYSPLYYANDSLVVWLDFENGYLDAGPLLRDGTAVGGSAIADDATRGNVHVGSGTGDRIDLPAFNSPASYTKAFWVKKASNTASGSVLSSASTHERIAFSSSGTPPSQVHRMTVSHEAGTVGQITWAWGTAWTHVVVTYDADSTTLAIYINGESIGANSSAAQRSTLGPLHAVGYNGGAGMNGSVDDARLYCRAMDAAEAMALYRATR